MMKCKWAGDAGDEYCKNCNGVTMLVEGKEVPCTECAGYEEGTESVGETDAAEDVANTATEEPIMNEPVQEQESPQETVKDKPSNKPTTKSTSKPKTTKETANKQDTAPIPTANSITTGTIGSTVALRYMSGASVDKNGVWYKFECCEERKLPEGLSEEQVQEEREKLWASLNAQVDAQIEDVLK